ncbi:alpha-L-fucosidase 2 isoform X3 [Physcomitrium patens]|nr:alpha-L-fucosidase 2-like isoform X3 [Physcomitrium patens]|eukprot:XP_024403838.1 alpha-L-fucosidase 2-like isoform X3 [Physcomitrella patens]
MRIAGSKSGSVSFSVTLDSQLMLGKEVVGSKYIALKGQCPIDSNKVTEVASPTRSSKKQGMEFVAVLQVEVSGEAGRLQVVDKQTLKVHQADWAVLYLTASSSFDGPFKDPSISGIEPTSLAFAALANLVDLSFDDILAAHLADYQTLFHRVSLRLRNHRCIDGNPDSSVFEDVDNEEKDLGLWELIVPSEIVESKTVESGAQVSTGVDGEVYPQNAWKERISTRDRILNFDGDEDPDLVVLLFQFGRYLLIASSRPNSFVSNLQGVWSNSLHPAWRCCPTLNINLEMNYWPAETCSLAECHLPLFDFLEQIAVTGATTAKVNYGLGGWVSHHNADIWAHSAPVSGDPVWALWPMSGAWICLHLWEHYTFSQDEEFLRNRAYPLFKGCAEFFVNWLVEDGKGHLVTNPSTSPEHHFIAPDGQSACVSYGSTMDMAILHNFFNAVVSAAKIVGQDEAELVSEVKSAVGRLLPAKIGSDGRLLEWVEEFKDPEDTHRHMSHLFGLYPGHSITPQSTPELCAAATQSILKRGEIGPGWSTAWKTALWARLWNSDHAYSMIKRMFTLVPSEEKEERFDGGGLYSNLFSAHPPFQIDGNLGFTAAVAEMLFQSDESNLYLLPALPLRKWCDGLIAGLRGRGAVTVGIRWLGGNLQEVTVQVEKNFSATRMLHYNTKVVTLPKSTSGPQLYTYDGDLNLTRSRSLEDLDAGGDNSCIIL